MKTKLLIGKTLVASLILLIVSIPFMTSASATYSPYALPTTSVYTSPSRVVGTSPGQTVTVDINITNVANLFSFEMGVTFNPAVVNTTASSVTEGGFLSNNGADTLLPFPGTVDNTAGTVEPYGWTLLNPALSKTGSGTLMHIVFKMKAAGFSDLHIIGVKLVLDDGTTLIPAKTIDYFTAVVGSNEYIVQVIGNPYRARPPAAGFSGYSAYNFALVDKTVGGKTYKGELNFTVLSYGTAATATPSSLFAYFNATIPNILMNCTNLDDWGLLLDDTLQGLRTVTQNSTYTTVSFEFTYNQLPQIISLYSTNAVPEFPTIFLAILLMLATFAAAIIGKSTRATRRKS